MFSSAHTFEPQFQAFVEARLSTSSTIHQAMKYALLTGGKRIRPLFALEAAELAGLPSHTSLPIAFALEIVHAFSLVHDDLPCMDNDDFRRGLPTVHRKYGEAQALLAGDALLTFAQETFLEAATHVAPQNFKAAYSYFLKATQEMMLGQSEELLIQEFTLDQLLNVQSMKTGALFKASILCPLLLSGKATSDSLYQDCEKYADAFGFAFQIMDDLEDEAQDQAQNTKNILSHLGRPQAIESALQKLSSSPVSSQFSATELLKQKLSKF